MTDCVEFIYISLLHFSQDVKLISYFDKTNKKAIRLNLHFFPLCNMFFLLCCRLNVSLNELYPDKTNKNKDYNFCRAATNDYFDNRLVGRLLFRLIGLNKIMLFIDKIHTIPHSAQCPSNTQNAMKRYSASFIKPPVIKRKQIF